ncbi:MAG: transcriptional repressor [Kiloniellaceae bacterium]
MTAFNNASASFSGARHDHRRCVTGALANAAGICARRRVRLTDLRRRVLELVWDSHAPVGAYDILGRLATEQGRAAPPTVYRALEFLLDHGLIHRIESLNAYVGCVHPDGAHGGQFLICGGCGAAAEVHDPQVEAAIARRAADLGFAVRRKTVEVEGLCPPCQQRREEGADAG